MLDVLNQGVVALLVVVGSHLVYLNFRTVFLPRKTGIIVSMGDSKVCSSCGITGFSEGRSSLPIQVRLDDGVIVSAETSPCCVCIDKLGVGSRVGLTQIGSRLIAYRVGSLAMRLRRMIG
jgi:hypothetical protein